MCFLGAEHNLSVRIFSQVPAHRWQSLGMSPPCQQRGRDTFKHRSSSEVLVRCSYKILLASHPGVSLRVHSFIHSFRALSAGYCPCLWPSWGPYILYLSPQRGSDLLLFWMSEEWPFSRVLGYVDFPVLGLWSTLVWSERTRVLYSQDRIQILILWFKCNLCV